MKINLLAILYAFSLFVVVELIINVYRISRLTAWSIEVSLIVISMICLFVLLFFAKLIASLLKKWRVNKKASHWLVFMWFPYFSVFYMAFTHSFPLNTSETWFPIFNLLIYGVLVCYPLAIIFMNRLIISEKEMS